jgi:hypothetical protein
VAVEVERVALEVTPFRGKRIPDAQGRCVCCGAGADEDLELVLKRGAVVVAFDPILVTWRGQPIPLSPTEANVYAHICRRGRVTFEEIDRVLSECGANPSTRSLVLGHIRGKFRKVGACEPFEKVGPCSIRLCVDPDSSGTAAPIIGLKLPRYATVR